MDKEDWSPLTKEDFEPGPYSCWLREQLLGEAFNPKTYGLFKKYNVIDYDDDYLYYIIMNFCGIDSLPLDLRKIAEDIIRLELDDKFELWRKDIKYENFAQLTKKHFEPSSPFKIWLRQQLEGEAYNYLGGYKDRGLFKKHNVRDYGHDYLEHILTNFRGLDGLPEDLRKVAVDIIRIELDENFEL